MESEVKTVTVDVADAFAIKTDTGELCRLCANTDNQLMPIFRGEGLEHSIATKIEKYLPIINVTELDKLPLQICYQCASTLIAWNNLYEGCRVADKRLREILCIDDKLYPEDETFEDYVDDYRDNYDEQTHNIPTPTPSTSNLESNILRPDATDITQLNDAKTFNETELDSTDERYAKNGPPLIRSSPSSTSAVTVQGPNEVDGWSTKVTLSPARPSSPSVQELTTHSHARKIEFAGCACSGDEKCAGCVERDNLRCNFCPMVFVTKTAIARHLKSNHKKEIVPAREAKRSAIGDDTGPSKKARTEEVRNRFQCTVCSKVCLSVRGLNRHAVVHKGKSARVQVTCNFCDQSFASEDDKRGHVSSYHRIAVTLNDDDGDKANDGGVIPNTVCEINVKEEDEKENIKDIPDVDPFIEADTETKKPRRRAASAKKKAAVVKKESNAAFPCEDCDKKFEKKSSYVRHRNSDHCPSKDFVCDVCQKAFATEVVLKRHKGNVHRVRVKRTGVDGKGGEEKKEDPFTKWYVFADGQKHLKCDQCKYNSLWYHKGRFLEHYRIHTGEKPFTCDLCGKQFRTKTLLQKHVMFVHEGIKEHPCDICGRCFSDKRYMEDHRRIHTGERPYVCDLCGKTFKQSASLFIHKELHKGLRKHGCEMCGKRFTTRSSLTIHIKRHVGERNFICATCGKAFVDGKHLKDHMAVHSEERPFSCELCGGRFKLMKHLKQHGRTHKRDYIV